jgi:hypothetical protein
MTSPALAIGGMLVRRHRWGLAAVAGPLALAVAATAVVPAAMAEVVGLAWVLLMIGVCYLVAVFAFGFDTDVAGAGSCYPGRMFTLPVRTAALAGWPIVFGAATLAGLWLAAAGLLFRPWGYDTPLAWPALMVAAQFVWVQALLWWPFGLPWARVIVGMLIVHVPSTGVIAALNLGYSPTSVIGFLSVALVAGVVAAYAGVARARWGAVPRWDWLPRADRAAAPVRRHKRSAFGSVGKAQAWYEWRRHGFVLPLLVAGLLPFFLLPLFVDEHDPPKLVRNFALVLLVPVFFAGMAGSAVGKHNPWARDYYGVPSFTATRPMTTAGMVACKLRAAARTTLTAWAVTLAMTAAAVVLSGAHEALREMGRAWLAARPAVEVAGTAVAVAAVLVLLTWKRLVENLLIGLTGREWVIKGSLFAGLFAGFSLVLFGLWLLVHSEYHDRARDLVPWLLGVAVGLKLLAGAAAVRGLRRRRLVADRTLAVLAGVWLAVAATLGALFVWVVPGGVVATPTIVLAVVLVTPLARVSAMPLALDWNRHR